MSGDVREIHAAPLKKIPFLDQARNPAPTFRTLPGIALEILPVEGSEAADNILLQGGEESFDRIEFHGGREEEVKVRRLVSVLISGVLFCPAFSFF